MHVQVRELKQKRPWPSGRVVTVFDVPREARGRMIKEVFSKVPDAIKIVFK